MKILLASLASGVVFALGLGLSGMTQPSKVVGFLDISGDWDPSLAFVMIGAIAVHTIAYRVVPRMTAPVLAARFQIPTRQDINPRLLGGAVLFGLGWGLSGFCPGPALVSMVSGVPAVFIFVAGMMVGMSAFRLFSARTGGK